MRILLTGQSGLQIEPAFRRYAADTALFPHQSRLHFLKVESEMARLFLHEDPAKSDPAVWFRLVLARSITELRTLWNKAFDACIEKARQITDPNDIVVLNLHAAFYHSYTVEYISVYSSARLNQFRPDLVITLIDDAYDIHDRLREQGHIFHPSVAGVPSRVKTAFQLLRILDWRSKEIMISRQIAYDCGECPHYVLAMKHPKRTFFNLTSAHLPCVYLSHPISQVRRLLQQATETEKKRARSIIRTIGQIEDAATSRVVLFSPTTIDEFRFRTEETQSGRRLIPALSDRWNALKYTERGDLLFQPPRRLQVDPLWNVEGLDDREKELIAPILEIVADEVSRQISSRDHKLVEQCGSLLIFRPFFSGYASTGVRKELDYFSAFKAEDEAGRFCFIVMPGEDTIDLKVQFVEDRIRSALSLQDLILKGPASSFGFSEEERGRARGAVRSGLDSVAAFVGEIVASHGIDFPPRVSLESDFPIEGPKRLFRIADQALRDAVDLVAIYESRADYVEKRADLSGEAILDVFVEQLKIHQNEQSSSHVDSRRESRKHRRGSSTSSHEAGLSRGVS